MNKGWKIFIGILIFSIVLYFLYILFIVVGTGNDMKKMNEENRILSCNFNRKNSFEGKIDKIDRYEYSEYMNANLFELQILTEMPNEQIIRYQFDLKTNQKLLNEVYVGQKVFKNANEIKFELETTKGTRIKFLIPDCSEQEK